MNALTAHEVKPGKMTKHIALQWNSELWSESLPDRDREMDPLPTGGGVVS